MPNPSHNRPLYQNDCRTDRRKAEVHVCRNPSFPTSDQKELSIYRIYTTLFQSSKCL